MNAYVQSVASDNGCEFCAEEMAGNCPGHVNPSSPALRGARFGDGSIVGSDAEVSQLQLNNHQDVMREISNASPAAAGAGRGVEVTLPIRSLSSLNLVNSSIPSQAQQRIWPPGTDPREQREVPRSVATGSSAASHALPSSYGRPGLSPSMRSSPLGRNLRRLCKEGKIDHATAVYRNADMQAKLLVLPDEYAADFHELCHKNPILCPILAYSPLAGDPKSLIFTNGKSVDELLDNFDVRVDFPLYSIHHPTGIMQPRKNILDVWSSDCTTFLIDSGLAIDTALDLAGFTPRHWSLRESVPTYKTTTNLVPAGVFRNSQWVVSMRPYKAVDIDRLRYVMGEYRGICGEPVAWGMGAIEELGIKNIDMPDFGTAVNVKYDEGEIPVFWACGSTAQEAVIQARLPRLFITEARGHNLVMNKTTDEYLGLNSA